MQNQEYLGIRSVRPCHGEKVGESDKGSPTQGLCPANNHKAERAGVCSPSNLGPDHSSGLHPTKESMCGCKGAAREVHICMVLSGTGKTAA